MNADSLKINKNKSASIIWNLRSPAFRLNLFCFRQFLDLPPISENNLRFAADFVIIKFIKGDKFL